MPGAVRDNDDSTGHNPTCWFPSVKPTSFSGDVFANGRGIVRKDDTWQTHCCGTSCHTPVQDGCSPNVIVNGRGAARIGDLLSCGDSCATGSSDVIIN